LISPGHALETEEGDRIQTPVVETESFESFEPPPGFEDVGAAVLRKKNPSSK